MCAAELVKASKALVALEAFGEAREELRLAAGIAPQEAAPRKELAKLVSSNAVTPDATEEKVTKARDTAHANCVTALVPALDVWEKAARPEEFAQLATVAAASLGGGEALQRFELAWFEPYLVWARKADVERWEKGDEFVDGAWADAARVKELDAAHADWKSPWAVGDGVHEVRTVLPYRTAKRVLENVRSYRRFVIDEFAGEWEWKPSKSPLPIWLTGTQADYQARLREYDSGAAKSQASALYVQRTGGLCPVFLTFEPRVAGSGVKIDWPALLRDVRHEVAHQILYESCMAQGAGVGGNIDWVSEGLEGADRRYRSSMVKLCIEVHMARGGAKTFGECFGEVDLEKMQEEWREFVAGMSIQKG